MALLRQLTIFAVFLSLVSTVGASGYYDGYTTPAGYVYHTSDGYWWKDGYAYTRVSVDGAPSYYYSCGYRYCYYPNSYWQYTKVYSPAATVYKDVTDYSAGEFDKLLLGLAKQRDASELRIREQAATYASRLGMIRSLGLEGNFRIDGYGQSLTYPGSGLGIYGGLYAGSQRLGSYGSNADTLYGLSVNQIRQGYGAAAMPSFGGYGQINLDTYYQMSNRSVQAGQEYLTSANSQFNGLVQTAADGIAKANVILAEAQAAKIKLDAARPEPTITESTTTTVQGAGTGISGAAAPGYLKPMLPAGTRQDQAPAPGPEGETAFLRDVGGPHCASCHSGANAKKGFQISTIHRLTPAGHRAVLARILSTDPKIMMPPPDSKDRLTEEEQIRFVKLK
jgi:hypothetical protein